MPEDDAAPPVADSPGLDSVLADSRVEMLPGDLSSDGNLVDASIDALSADLWADGPVLAVDSTSSDAFADFSSGDLQPEIGGSIPGTVLDPTGILLGPANWVKDERAVASDGNDYLLVWNDESGPFPALVGRRISDASGALLDPAGIAIDTMSSFSGTFKPDLAFGGNSYFVVWQGDGGNSGITGVDIQGRRVASDGTVLDISSTRYAGPSAQISDPAVAYAGTNFLLAWVVDTPVPGGADIHAIRVSVDGLALDTNPIVICSEIGHQRAVAVAGGGGNFFVAWTDMRNSQATPDVFGTLVSDAGAVAKPNGEKLLSAAGLFL